MAVRRGSWEGVQADRALEATIGRARKGASRNDTVSILLNSFVQLWRNSCRGQMERGQSASQPGARGGGVT